jgi:hypothetical protein
MSEATAREALEDAIVALNDGESLGVSPDANEVSKEKLYEIADELRETYQVEAEIAWREEGRSSALFFKPWRDVRRNGDL